MVKVFCFLFFFLEVLFFCDEDFVVICFFGDLSFCDCDCVICFVMEELVGVFLDILFFLVLFVLLIFMDFWMVFCFLVFLWCDKDMVLILEFGDLLWFWEEFELEVLLLLLFFWVFLVFDEWWFLLLLELMLMIELGLCFEVMVLRRLVGLIFVSEFVV